MPSPQYTTQAKILAALEALKTEVKELVVHVTVQNGRIGVIEEKQSSQGKDLGDLKIIAHKTSDILEEHASMAGGAAKLNVLLEELAREKQEETWRKQTFSRVMKSLLGIAMFMGGIAGMIFSVAYLLQ